MKHLLSLSFALTALCVFSLTAGADDTAKPKAKKAQTANGVVKEVKAEKDRDAGELTLTIQKKGKKGEKAPDPVEKTVKVPEGTKVEFVSGKKGEKTTKPATFKDLKEGERLTVTLEGDTAKEIRIHEKKKAK
jgi:hypothetical protein